MKRKVKRLLVGIPVTLLILALAVYVLLALYYMDGFSYNTWVNGVYCTGKNIDEINSELKDRYEARPINIYNPDGTVEFIFPEEINYNIDFSDYLRAIKDKQNAFLWFENFLNWQKNADLIPVFSYDEEKLNEKINELSFVKSHVPDKEEIVEIEYIPEKGYGLKDTHINNINLDLVKSTIETSFYTDGEIRFDDSFLKLKEYTLEEQKTLNEWDNVSKYLEPRIVYDMGTEKIPVSREIMSDFLYFEDGRFIRNDKDSLLINEEAVRLFVDSLCDEYDTYTSERVFKSYSGEEKVITNIYYGTLINREEEYKYLYEALVSGKKEEHIPTYTKKGFVRGKNDIGLTYIEIDMGAQVLYYFEDGVLKLNADIVSGLPGGNATPQMICSVYNKRSPAILVGSNYRSPVKFWMGIYNAIGLHDASWQSAFGGSRYLTHGSHGCINMRLNDVSILYDSVEVGTPVILYY